MKVNNGSEKYCNTQIFSIRLKLNKVIMTLMGTNFTCYLFKCVLFFSNLLPLWDEENQHDKDFLKHHDEDVEDTLAQPCCALHWLSYTNTHTVRETNLCEKTCLGIQMCSTDRYQISLLQSYTNCFGGKKRHWQCHK